MSIMRVQALPPQAATVTTTISEQPHGIAMANQEFRCAFNAMGSSNEITIFCRDKSAFDELSEGAIRTVRTIESSYSRYQPTSVISRINAAAGIDWVEIDQELSGLLDYAEICWHESAGLFDLTSGVLRRVWNFELKQLPTPQLVAEVLPLIGWEKVQRSPGKVKLSLRGMQLDLGGIGKEFAVDKALSYLHDRHVSSAMINLGGDIGVLGPKPDGTSWQIGIRNPRAPDHCLATLALSCGGLATSGDYERFFEIEGRRYCHVLNPKTGFPVNELRSASVTAPSCLVAGSLSSMAMLAGKDSAAKLLKNSALAYLLIDAKGEAHMGP